MYLPAHFAENQAEALHALMREFPLATLMTQGQAGPEANFIPLHLVVDDSATRLVGHVARANPLWREHPADTPVLAVFHGPQAYVTPSWYPTKHEHGKAVPTWNYIAVQATGRLRVIDDAGWLRAQLESLVSEHEAGFAQPWQIADAPADYIEKMLTAIVGIEIEVTALQGKWKLSQNQPAMNRDGVIAGLRKRGETAVADAMESKRES